MTRAVNTAAVGIGGVIQVVTANIRTYPSTTSTSYVTTGLSATITPTSSTSKILVTANINGCTGGTTTAPMLSIFKNGVDSFSISGIAGYNGSFGAAAATWLDSPATTSAITYEIYFKRVGAGTATVYINNYVVALGDTVSTLTLMEIAG